MARYAIIGHSERRNALKETDEDLALKIVQAKNTDLNPYIVYGMKKTSALSR